MRAIGRRRTRNAIAKVSPEQIVGADDAAASFGAAERAIGAIADRVNALADESAGVYVADVDLAVGNNVIAHALGRKPTLVLVVPTSADASFAWGWNPDQPGNATPKLTTTITVAGVPMRARVEVR